MLDQERDAAAFEAWWDTYLNGTDPRRVAKDAWHAALRARLAEAEGREQALREGLEHAVALLESTLLDARGSYLPRESVEWIREFLAAAQPATAEPVRPAPRRRVWNDDAGPRDDGIEGPEDGFAVG